MPPEIREIRDIEVRCWVLEDKQRSDLQLRFENSAFTLNVADGTATFIFQYPLSSLEEAERRICDFIRSWEGDMLLQSGSVRRSIDISASQAPGRGGRANGYFTAKVEGSLAETNTRRQMPWRRHRYWHIPLVRGLVERYEAYRKGRENLTVMAYFCLSAIEQLFQGRYSTASTLKLEPKILSELGRLVSTVGTVSTARKITSENHDLRDLTDREVHWLEAVVRELIRRTGEHLEGGPLSHADFSHFPGL